jgi:hypothetical protein
LQGHDVPEYSLKPWSDDALIRWLDDIGLARRGIDRVRCATGNWGTVLHELWKRCGGTQHAWPRVLEEFEQEFTTTPKWWTRFGLIPEALQALAALDEYGPASADDVCGVMDVPNSNDVKTVFAWAELLGFVRQEGHGTYSVNALVGQAASKLEK